MNGFFDTVSQLHFIRPWWLLGLLVVPFFLWFRRTRNSGTSGWNSILSPELLEALVPKISRKTLGRVFDIVVSLSVALVLVALAGPSWEKAPQPVDRKQDNVVLILDLSLSMYVQDVSPSRLERAKHKLTDILRNRQEGHTGMVAYAGDAHVVTPLTSDTDTIKHLLTSLNPSMMPVAGSNVRRAIEVALQLLATGSTEGGRLLLLTDGINRLADLADLDLEGTTMHVVGVGTSLGGPIPLEIEGEVRHLKDEAGNVVRPILESGRLELFANSHGGTYRDIALGDSDVAAFFDDAWSLEVQTDRIENREFDLWKDAGYLLLIPVAILGLLGLRRGAVVVVLLFVGVEAQSDWRDDLWSSRDNQGLTALEEGRAEQAEELFQDPEWQAVAKYRNGKYSESADMFSTEDSTRAQFNLGNALAHSGQIEQAIEAYDQVLSVDPEHEDAKFNRDLLAQFLQEQASQSQQGEGDSESADGEGEPGEEQQGSQEGQSQEQSGEQSQSGQADQSDPGEQNGQEQQELAEQESEQESDESQNEQSRQETPGDSEEESESTSAQTAEERESADAFDRKLRRIPDEPGELLENKFRSETVKRVQRGELKLDQGRQAW